LKSRDKSIFDKRKVENNAIDYIIDVDYTVIDSPSLRVGNKE